MKVISSTQEFYWNNKSIKYSLTNNGPVIFYKMANDICISLDQIIQSSWDKNDFLIAIICWKEVYAKNFMPSYLVDGHRLYLKDLEKNLDKYLNATIIKQIIE